MRAVIIAVGQYGNAGFKAHVRFGNNNLTFGRLGRGGKPRMPNLGIISACRYIRDNRLPVLVGDDVTKIYAIM